MKEIFQQTLQQTRGALKLAAIIILLIGALEIWILKDQRHFSIVITNKGCQNVLASNSQMDAFNQFNPAN